jgi:diguanylate cyclase (GGDEF)-like protein
MASPSKLDPYVDHDAAKTGLFAGLVWLVYGVAVLALLPIGPGDGLALGAGALVGVTAMVAGLALVRGWQVGYGTQLAFTYVGVAGLFGLQLLYPRNGGELLTELYLPVVLQAAAVHPLRRSAGVLVVTVAALLVQETQAGWTANAVANLAIHTGVYVIVALIANSLVVALREQRAAARAEEAEAQRLASTDALTGLGNRRRLIGDLDGAFAEGATTVLALFDLDGFKAYNDTFGHPAGDALLHKLGDNLLGGLAGRATAYRMGGDEFCVLAPAIGDEDRIVEDALRALTEQGEAFSISASYGSVVIPVDAQTNEDALRAADRRMYANKASGRASAGRQSTDVLLGVLRERHPELGHHVEGVTRLCEQVAERLELSSDERTTLLQAAKLHDVGKAAIPDAIVGKPGPLNGDEWAFMRQHTIIGERIMSAAPALNRASQLVRWSHERLDGEGYPDRLSGEAIPLGSRIISVCDAFDAMLADRPYRPAMTLEMALAELRACAGTQFDPAVVEALCEVALDGALRPSLRAPASTT